MYCQKRARLDFWTEFLIDRDTHTRANHNQFGCLQLEGTLLSLRRIVDYQIVHNSSNLETQILTTFDTIRGSGCVFLYLCPASYLLMVTIRLIEDPGKYLGPGGKPYCSRAILTWIWLSAAIRADVYRMRSLLS